MRTLKLEFHNIIPELQPFIKVICCIENAGDSASPCTFRALPDTCVEIFFDYISQPTANIKTKTPIDGSKSFVTSRMSKYRDVQIPPNSGSVAVCFHPGAAFRFFHFPMKELTDNNILLFDLWGNKINELEAHIARCNNQKEIIAAIQKFLLNFIQRRPGQNNHFHMQFP